MLAACDLCGKSQPDAKDISDAMPRIEHHLTDDVFTTCLERARLRYDALGGTDKVAKGRELENKLKEELITLYPTLV